MINILHKHLHSNLLAEGNTCGTPAWGILRRNHVGNPATLTSLAPYADAEVQTPKIAPELLQCAHIPKRECKYYR
jgi:hypothetical protein